MNAEKLYVKKFKGLGEWEYKESKVFYCGECKKVYNQEILANECCSIRKCCECGKDCEQKYYTACNECLKKKELAREKEKFDKAEKIDIKDYDGYLLSDEWASDDFYGYFENYFEDHDLACPKCGGETEINDGLDKIHSFLSCKCGWESPKYEVIDEIYYLFAPEYIWATEFKPLELDLSNILENATEEHHESVNDYMKGTKELKEAIDKFNELNKDNEVGTYNESRKLALINIKEYIKELYNK